MAASRDRPGIAPTTPASGGVTPHERYQNASGRICRAYDVFVRLNQETAEGIGRACRHVSGKWTHPDDLVAPRRPG